MYVAGWIPIYLDRCVISNVAGETEVEHFHKENIGGPEEIAEPTWNRSNCLGGTIEQSVPILIQNRRCVFSLYMFFLFNEVFCIWHSIFLSFRCLCYESPALNFIDYKGGTL